MDDRICDFCGEPLPDTIQGSYCYECEGFPRDCLLEHDHDHHDDDDSPHDGS